MKPAFRAAIVLGVAALAAWLLVLALRMDVPWFELHLMRLRCVVDPAELRSMTGLRIGLGVVGVVLLLALRPLARGLARPGAGGTVVRVGIAVLLALVVSDLVIRSKSHYGEAPIVLIQLPPVRDDAKLGWVYDGPRTSVIVDDGRAILYATGADGQRLHDQKDVIDPGAPTVLFVGESVTFGLGVHWEETFAAAVGQRLGVQIVNTGVHGYGEDQVYLRTLDRLQALQKPVAVVDLVMADLLERDVPTWREHLEPGDDGSFLRIPAQPVLFRRSPVVALVERLGPWQSSASVRVARALYLAIDRAARDRGAHALFVLTNYQRPCLPDASGRPSIEGLLFDGLPVHHVRADLDPAAIIHSNGHPNPSSHAVIADAVVAALREALVVGSGP
jgi:hypothetical protein